MKNTILLLATLSFVACRDSAETTQVKSQAISESIYASGLVKSENQYLLFAAANGIIEEILVEEGDSVSEGQIIMRISNEAQQLSRENAELQAQYSNTSNSQDKLREAMLQVDLSKNKMSNDSIMYLRQQNLWAKEIGTKVELEQRKLAFESSTANYKAAVIRYQELKRQIKLSAKQSENNLKISEQMQKDFVIRSKVNGRVYQLNKVVGEMVNPQTVLGIVGERDKFILEMEVDEKDIFRLKIGQKMIVRLDSYKDKRFSAELTKISPVMNERNKSFTVEASFIEGPEALYPNITFEANIIIQRKEKALLIPRNYLVNDSTVLDKDGKEKSVKIGLMDYQMVEITEGLSLDETIQLPSNK